MYKILEKGRKILVEFRARKLFEYPVMPLASSFNWQIQTTSITNKPLFVILAFSTNKNNIVKENITEFNHLNIRNARLYLNSTVVPYENLNLDFTTGIVAMAYKYFLYFPRFYY